MSEDGAPPAAAGTLAKTPLAHLVVYILRRRLDGSLVFKGAFDDEHVVFFRAGMPALVKTDYEAPSLGQTAVNLGYLGKERHDETLKVVGRPGMLHLELLRSAAKLSLEQFEAVEREHVNLCMLALFRCLPKDAAYAFHPDVNLAITQESDAVMPVDPYPLLWRAACGSLSETEIESTLARLGELPIELPSDAVVDDFGFGPNELVALQSLRANPVTLSALIRSGVLPEDQWKRLLYVLLITRNLVVATLGRPSLSPASNPLRTGPEGLHRVTSSLFEPVKGADKIALAHPLREVRESARTPAARVVQPIIESPPAARVEPSKPRYLYLAFVATLIPLFLSLRGTSDNWEARLASTLTHHPELAGRVSKGHVPTSEILAALPEGRLEGAHLSWDSTAHWLYGALAVSLFVALLLGLFDRGRAKYEGLAKSAAFVGAAGLGTLLLLQWLSGLASSSVAREAGLVGIVFLACKAIAYSFHGALDPDYGLLPTFAAFTLGVGLAQELFKAAPLLWHYRREASLDWHGAALSGLANGAVLGVVEGVVYCADHYNGVQALDSYLTRFVTCVALQALWGGSIALALEEHQELVQEDHSVLNWVWVCARLLAVPVVLHGLFDTLLKRGLEGPAFAVAIASVAWFAWRIERSRRNEGLQPRRDK